jgi:hypothetical protein
VLSATAGKRRRFLKPARSQRDDGSGRRKPDEILRGVKRHDAPHMKAPAKGGLLILLSKLGCGRRYHRYRHSLMVAILMGSRLGYCILGPLLSEGKGHTFESCRVRQ